MLFHKKEEKKLLPMKIRESKKMDDVERTELIERFTLNLGDELYEDYSQISPEMKEKLNRIARNIVKKIEDYL